MVRLVIAWFVVVAVIAIWAMGQHFYGQSALQKVRTRQTATTLIKSDSRTSTRQETWVERNPRGRSVELGSLLH